MRRLGLLHHAEFLYPRVIRLRSRLRAHPLSCVRRDLKGKRMTDTDDAIADLQAFKAMLVTARRRLVAAGVRGNKNTPRAPGAPYEMSVGPNTSRSGEVRALQDDIDAVNRAIRDERDGRVPVGDRVAGEGAETAN